MAPHLGTPGEMIKYILDKQKETPLTNEGLAAAIVAAVGAQQPLGPCYGCGQMGHIKVRCPNRSGVQRPQGLWGPVKGPTGPVCWNCGGRGHTARQCPRHEPRRGAAAGKRKWEGPSGPGPLPYPVCWADPAPQVHHTPTVALTLDCRDCPLVKIFITYPGVLPPEYTGPRSVSVTALVDSGADVTVISDSEWPTEWPVIPSQAVAGVGGSLPTGKSKDEAEIILVNRDGTLEKPVLLVPLVAKVPGTLLGRDFLRGLGARITNLY